MKPQFQVPPHESEPRCFYLVVALILGLIQKFGPIQNIDCFVFTNM